MYSDIQTESFLSWVVVLRHGRQYSVIYIVDAQ